MAHQPPVGRPQWWALLLLVGFVAAAHWWLADAANLQRWGLGADAAVALPKRMEVAFVRELAQRTPAPLAPAPPLRAARGPAAPAAQPAPAASAPQAAAPAPDMAVAAPQPEAAASAPADATAQAPGSAAAPALPPAVGTAASEAETATTAPATATATATAADATAAPSEPDQRAAEPFAWPPSTRLSYTLTGQYRGPVEGQAQVEWLLDGARYQVHMDLSIGPAFAPLASRRVSSEGVVTAQGLSPRRYDELTRAFLRSDQRLTVWLDDDRLRLANGRNEPRPPGVQDSASQFVHLTWLFTTQPGLLRAGQSITLPLALPRQLEAWVYDVLGTETLQTPAGEVQTFHVKPRRPPQPGRDLTAEIWVAPSLQYLPVRIVIRQDEQTFLDLLITRLPQQAAPQR